MNKDFFDSAFYYAKQAYNNDEVPIGAVIVKNNEIISFGYNSKEKNKSVIDHAEIIAILEAEKFLNNWRLDDCDLYVTLDPCPMCASAIKQSRIKNVYSALNNSDEKNLSIIKNIFENTDKTNKMVNFYTNLDVERGKKILNSFFREKR